MGKAARAALPIRFAKTAHPFPIPPAAWHTNRLNLLAPWPAAGQESLRRSWVVHRWKEKKSQLSAAVPPV